MFTTAMAGAAGYSASALHCGTTSGRISRIRRGVFTAGDPKDPLLIARAAALVYPDLPLSHLSAARLRDIPIVGRQLSTPEMTVPPRSNANLPGIHPYRARLREHEVERVGSILVTSPARTVIDIARRYPLFTAVTALDYVLHEGHASAEDILDVLAFCRSWPGAPRARKAVALCDSRAESPLESVSRLVMMQLRLPAPEPQVIILDDDGTFIGRADFCWDSFGVVGEADGLKKYDGDQSMGDQNDRQEDFADTGLEVTRWGWQRVWQERALFRGRVERALERGAANTSVPNRRRWQTRSTPKIAIL